MGFKKHKHGEGRFNKQKKEPVHFDKTESKKDKIFFDDNSNVDKKWFNRYKDDLNEECPQLPFDEVDKLKAEAQKLLENETTLYNSRTSKSSAKSEYGWIHTIMNKGTVSDRIAAHTVAIQDAPLYTLPLLKNLVSMAKVSKKNECITVLDTLTELFLSDLLRPKNKLRNFENCPLALLDKLSSGNHQSRKSHLIHWYYEDQLKELYHAFVTSLHAAAQDTVERTKEKAISAMYKLLAGNPEHEAILLKNIINKLGDPSQKVASKAIYSLVQLLHAHPNMKFVVMEETEKLLFRPNVGHKAQYYGICFLSQFLLTVEDTELARGLIQIYFSFFKACVKKGEVDSRLMSALLIGVNRAYPFAKPDMDKMLDHIDTMYRVVHHANFNVSLHTLSLLFQVTDFANSVSDRFYSALYKKMLDPELASSSQQALFLSLVFKALKRDEDINRTKVFFKRLLQICAYVPVPLICGILYMVSQLSKNKETVIALKMEAANMVEDEDGQEHYEDVKIEDMLTDVPQENGNEMNAVEIDPPKPSIPTWYHCENQVSGTVKRKNNKAVYDPLQRNPSFAGGEHCVYTELLKLSQHFHPTVILFANNILRGEVIKYPGDPLLDFSLPRFLDRFVFKNPKKDIKNDVIKQNKFSRKKSYFPSGIRSLCVNSASYLNEDDSRIPVDELFMYRYLKKKRGDHKGKVKEKEENDYDSDVSSVGSEDFNEILDRMMGGSKNDDLDFAEDVAKSKSKKSKDSDDEDEMENDDDAEADGDESEDDGEVDGDEFEDDGSENDFIDEDLDDDAEDIVFDGSDSDIDLDEDDEDENDGDAFEGMPNEKRKNHKDRKGKKKFSKDDSVFVSAEEFSEMLDNMGASGRKASGSSAFSTKDRAGAKQLKWETARDFWVKKGEKKPGKNQNNKRKWNGRPGGKRDERNAKRRKKR